MTWTNYSDVVDAWIGDDAPESSNLVDLWIGKAERLIRFMVPGIQARIDLAEPDLLENATDVTVAMVIRVFRNPLGVRQMATTTGPFTEQQTFGGNKPGELELLENELARLIGDTSRARSAFTIDTIPTTSRFSPGYVAGGQSL